MFVVGVVVVWLCRKQKREGVKLLAQSSYLSLDRGWEISVPDLHIERLHCSVRQVLPTTYLPTQGLGTCALSRACHWGMNSYRCGLCLVLIIATNVVVEPLVA
jgi:hypothetical protein